MIFEFFKRLLWRADEGNQSRKRKADEFNPTSNKENCCSPKKYCSDPSMMHQNKIIEEADKLSHSKFSAFSTKSKISVLRPAQFEPNGQAGFSRQQIPTNYKGHSDFWQAKPAKSSNQSTLLETYRHTARKQYDSVLHNYTFSTTLPTPSQIETRRLKEKLYPTKIQTLNKNDITPSVGQILDKTLQISQRRSSFGMVKPTFQPKSQSRVVEVVDLENEAEKEKTSPPSPKFQFQVPTPQVNSMREKLASKAVTHADFINNIGKKYNKNQEQRQREIKEMEKMTMLLNRTNQLKREALLENQLNKSLKIYEETLDESLLPPEEPKLPELTEEMLGKVRSALNPRPSDQILVQDFGLRIARKDMQTLANLNWLNDEIINFYMNLLIKRGSQDDYPSVYAMNTFFYPKLLSGGHASLKRWTRKVDLFSKDLIVVPVHLGVHWCMSIIDMRNKCIKYFDSMGSPNNKCLQMLKQYLQDECLDKKKQSFDFTGWNFENVRDIPQQTNGSDCGVFSCVFAEHVCANRDFNFSQDDMPYFRNKMVYEILTAQLL